MAPEMEDFRNILLSAKNFCPMVHVWRYTHSIHRDWSWFVHIRIPFGFRVTINQITIINQVSYVMLCIISINICIFTEYSYDIPIYPLYFLLRWNLAVQASDLVPTLPGYSATWQPYFHWKTLVINYQTIKKRGILDDFRLSLLLDKTTSTRASCWILVSLVMKSHGVWLLKHPNTAAFFLFEIESNQTTRTICIHAGWRH